MKKSNGYFRELYLQGKLNNIQAQPFSENRPGEQAVNPEYQRIRAENEGLSGSLSARRFQKARVVNAQ